MPQLRTAFAALAVVLFPFATHSVTDAHAAPPAAKTHVHTLKPSHSKSGLVRTSAQMPAPAKPTSKSVGSPTDGHLINGMHLPEAPYWRVTPSYKDGDARWGTESLVTLIDRAAKSVRSKFPDAVLSVGHLSKHGGGEIDRHASHESGRDADLGFFVKNVAGKPIYADHFVAFEGDGRAKSWPGAQFDDARNWALVSAIVGDGRAHVTHIFVATPIRARLLAYADKIGAPQNIKSRAAELMAQPRGSLPHDDHFHVRIACPGNSDGKCVELPVRHPKHIAAAAAAAAHRSQARDADRASRPTKAPVAPSQAQAHAAPAPKPREKSSDDRSEIPSLAQPVPGLDSAVIPAPLAKSTWGTSKDAPAPVDHPIDDPDGVLESK